jgi:outer membrane protein OmpA-like peptidoglycan-associated protein
VGAITSLISNFAGVKQSSIGSILSAITPVALGFIGRHALSNNLSAGGIVNWLTGQKSQIANAVPAGLNLSGIFNGGTQKVADTVRHNNYAEPEKTGNKWLWPIILGLLALGLLWYFLKGCNKDVATPVVTDTVAVTTPAIIDTAVAIVAAPVRESFKVKLPDGTELEAYKGGIEDKLVSFLNDPNSVAGKDVWFDFDNLNFETASATITAESQVQVNNIAAILKAYPKVEIKIGGYTDVTGDAAANKKLSQDRANSVEAALKTAGTNATQLQGAEGYGSQFAKAAADASDDEKKKDRRIAVSVRKK